MVYFIKLIALLRGIYLIKKLNKDDYVLRYKNNIYISDFSSIYRLKSHLNSYVLLFEKTLEHQAEHHILIYGIEMFNALKCFPNIFKTKQLIYVEDINLLLIQSIQKLETNGNFSFEKKDESALKFNLILAHASAIPDFEKCENLCNSLGKGQLYIKVETGNIAGLNQFEKLRLFFTSKKGVLVSTYPLNEESDIILIEKKWV